MTGEEKGLFPRGRDRAMGVWSDLEDSFGSLQRDMQRLFKGFPHSLDPDFWSASAGRFVPRINVSRGKDKITVTAECPGMDEKDVELKVTEHALVIKGEKKEEKEEKDDDHHLIERSFGSFRREIPLPDGAEGDKAEARFKKGVLRVTVPLNQKAQEKSRKIDVKGE